MGFESCKDVWYNEGVTVRMAKQGRFAGKKGRFNLTNILLCGANGKMGHVVESVVSQREDLAVTAGIDCNTTPYADFPICAALSDFQGKADVVVDFSHPALLRDLLDYCVRTGTPLVAATTGYTPEQVQAIRDASEKVAIFFTFNLSIGINLLIDLAQRAAAVLGDSFDVEIVEKHHRRKLDAPSGTALMLADAVNQSLGDRCQYEYDRHSRRQSRPANEIGIHSVRGGTIVGEHEVIFAGRDEVLTLSHSAASKEVFAVGAVNAAAFLAGKPAGLYRMKDLLQSS